MKNRITKSIISSLISASMLASAAIPTFAPLSIYAEDDIKSENGDLNIGEDTNPETDISGDATEENDEKKIDFNSGRNMLGQNDFDNGIGLPWHCVSNYPAQQTFDISNGSYNVHILLDDGPESLWDLQFRHLGLNITAGHKYIVSFDITSSEDGEIYTQISDLKGENPVWLNCLEGTQAWSYSGMEDPNGYEHEKCLGNLVINKGLNHFECEFTAQSDIELAEWAFNYGGAGDFQDHDCFPDGTVLQFDNMQLRDCSDDNVCVEPIVNDWFVNPHSNVRINQLGYNVMLNKKASYVTDSKKELPFEVRDENGEVVYEGKTKLFGKDNASGSSYKKDSGDYVHIIDFSDIRHEGTFTIFVKDDVGVTGTSFNGEEGYFDTRKEGDKLISGPYVFGGKTYVMNESPVFSIKNNIYSDQLLMDSVNYMYQNRADTPIRSEYITSGDKERLAHRAAYTNDVAYVQNNWNNVYPDDLSGADKEYKVNVSGGWYSSGNYWKDVVEGAPAVWTLQNTFENTIGDTDNKWNIDIQFPMEQVGENTNAPQILQEARYELEWMMKMIVDEDDPYWGDHAGMVYSRVRDAKWTSLSAEPRWSEDIERIITPPTYAATLDFAACAAQAARLWKPYDEEFAKKCLDAAEKAYRSVDVTALNILNNSRSPFFAPYANGVGTNLVADSTAEDDYYWAGCELYITTGDKSYYELLKQYENKAVKDDKAFSLTTSLTGGDNNNSFTSFNNGNTAGYGTLSLLLNPDGLTETEKEAVEKSVVESGKKYLKQIDEEGMGVPYKSAETIDQTDIGMVEYLKAGYEYGSNEMIVNNALVLAYAYKASGDAMYLNGAAEAMDYIFGRNALGFSYVSGYGENSLKNPHHKYWLNQYDPDAPKAPDGVLALGPCSGLFDAYVAGLGFVRCIYDKELMSYVNKYAPQRCYVDGVEAYSVNETSVGANAPLAAVVSFLHDEVGKLPQQQSHYTIPHNEEPTVPANQPTESVTQPAAIESKICGDTNGDNEVTLADSLVILQYIANGKKYALDEQALENADCVDRGEGVTALDALAVQAVDAKLIKASELPIESSRLEKK